MENLRKRLAIAVRRIQWSYAIFWSISPPQTGVLIWGDGYYNGDIKTRRTVQAQDSSSAEKYQLVMQRTESLRELYESLLVMEMGSGDEHPPQHRRPSTSLSPEDLTDSEWYFLVCMSFVFNVGQGLPGRSLAKGKTIWLHNAHLADSKVFSRSLLAKSASIQTVVCFPYLGGVVELGITELVSKDLNLIEQVKTYFLEIPCPAISKTPNYAISTAENRGNNNIIQSNPNQIFEEEEEEEKEEEEDEEEENLGSIESSSPFTEEEIISNSSDSMCQTLENHQRVILSQDDSHYKTVLSVLFKSSNRLILGKWSKNGEKESSFVRWKPGGSGFKMIRNGSSSQKLLKKVLFQVGGTVGDEKKRQTPKMDERFMVLGSLVPSIAKDDKERILDDTIEYLKELERRIEELESCRGDLSKKQPMNKRKACEMDQNDIEEKNLVSWRDGSFDDLTVKMIEEEVMIEVTCSWREGLLLEIVAAMNNLQMDYHTVRSSNCDGILKLSVRSKFKGSKVVSERVIRRALEEVVCKC